MSQTEFASVPTQRLVTKMILVHVLAIVPSYPRVRAVQLLTELGIQFHMMIATTNVRPLTGSAVHKDGTKDEHRVHFALFSVGPASD